MEGMMIIKVQVDAAGRSVLAYDEDRSFNYFGDLEDDLRQQLKYTGGLYKKFWHGYIFEGVLHLTKPAPWQQW